MNDGNYSRSDEPNPQRMLEGFRVLDFTHLVAGPTCTRILAEMGADVIKVERSAEGDHLRQFAVAREGMSTYFFQHNHSKRNLAIDVRRPEAKEIILKLITKMDVVVENFAPGVIGAMGFGYEALRKINPGLIMLSLSVAGQDGPLSYKPGYDHVGQALAAVTDQIGEADRTPVLTPMAIGDVSAGVASAMAVGFALIHKMRTGEGQFLDASLLDTYFHMHDSTVPLVSMRKGNWVPHRTGSMHPNGSPSGVFKAANGYIFLVVLPHEIDRLWRAMRKPELAKDPRFATPVDRVKNNLALKEIIEKWLATFSDRDSAVAALDSERVPCAPVYNLAEAMAHPHLRQRKTVRRVKDKTLGEMDIPGMPVKFSRWPDRTEVAAGQVGEHNEEILSELLGMRTQEFAHLYSEGILLRGGSR